MASTNPAITGNAASPYTDARGNVSFQGSVNKPTIGTSVAPAFTAAPVILGTPTVGVAVPYQAGTVTGNPTPTRSVQWLLDGAAISGATGATYTPVSGDVGVNRLSIRESAINAAGSAISTSAAVSVQAGGSASPSDVTTVSIEGVGTQLVTFGHVFATWGDGSVKHAVITASVTGGTAYRVRSDTPAGGASLTVSGLLAAVAGNIATVTLTGGVTGTASLRNLLESATNRAPGGLQTIEQGPNMLGVVVAQDFSTHVRITFHLRWYGGTTLWCDFIAENGYGNVNSQSDKSYTAVCDLNGSTVLNTGAITHWNHAMWHRAGWSSGGTLYVKHNVAYLRDTVKAVPYYDPSVSPSSTFLNTLPSTLPAPMAKTAFWAIPDDIESPGYSDHIGIMARWDALYVKAGGDSRAFNAMLTAHDSCGVYPSSYISSSDGEHMRVSDYTTTSITNGTGFGTGYATTANLNGPLRTGWMASHSPSVGFLPYLLTGRYAYLRAMTAWASEHAMWGSTGRNTTYSGMTVRGFPQVQQRGWGWTYRTVAQCAWLLPSAHSSKAYFNNTVLRNFELDHADYVNPGAQASARGGGVIGFLYQYDWEQVGGSGNYSGFMHAFLCQAVSYCVLDLGFSTGLDFAEFTGKFIAGLMGAGGHFPFEWAPQYSWQAGATHEAWYSTWAGFRGNASNLNAAAQSLDASTSAMASNVDLNDVNHTGLRNELTGDMGSNQYYYANYLAAVSYLERLGVDGGWACWYRTTLCGRKPDFSQIPQFGIWKREMPLPA